MKFTDLIYKKTLQELTPKQAGLRYAIRVGILLIIIISPFIYALFCI
jgi:CBS domain containing-hemolysin-like protein